MARRLAIDTNLLLLFVVGLSNESYIGKHRRLQTFDIVDFRLVTQIARRADRLVFVPNVLAETSNLLRQIDEPIRTELMRFFGAMLQTAEESYVPSKAAATRTEFIRLGLTDAVLLTLANTGASLLTVDLGLYLAAQTAGYEVENYNHVREARPDYT